MSDWSNRFTVIPHAEDGRDRDGADCLGLVRIIYAEMLGITLPDYLGRVCEAEHAEIEARLKGETSSIDWRPVERGEERAFDLLTFMRGPWVRHLGVVVRPGLMIHAAPHVGASLAPYDYGYWNSRFNGLHRHVLTGGSA